MLSKAITLKRLVRTKFTITSLPDDVTVRYSPTGTPSEFFLKFGVHFGLIFIIRFRED